MVALMGASAPGVSSSMVPVRFNLIPTYSIYSSTRACRSSVHDPFVSGPLDCPALLQSATSHTNIHSFIDRLAPHRDNSVHQENPLIPQSIWENCRPLRRQGFPQEREWRDTVDLVCNSAVSVFRPGRVPGPSSKLSSLQKLCIIRSMRGGGGPFHPHAVSQAHRDYVFSPTCSLRSELCMVLQERYFFLPDVNFADAGEVSPDDVVREITFGNFVAALEYGFDPSRLVTADEVAFGPKVSVRCPNAGQFPTYLIRVPDSTFVFLYQGPPRRQRFHLV